jgi:hypothetical protein
MVFIIPVEAIMRRAKKRRNRSALTGARRGSGADLRGRKASPLPG